jgi:hypothetical protein
MINYIILLSLPLMNPIIIIKQAINEIGPNIK